MYVLRKSFYHYGAPTPIRGLSLFVYINNRTYDIILYQNVILKLNKNIANKQEVIDDFKEIINNVKLQNQGTLTSREREEKTS